MLNLDLISQLWCRHLFVWLSDQCLSFINNLRSQIVVHVHSLNTMVMEDGKTGVSWEDTLYSIPSELDSHRAHPAKRTLNYESIFLVVLYSAELPLDLVLVTHIIVVVDRLLRWLEMPWEMREVKELELLTHLLNLSSVNHLDLSLDFGLFIQLQHLESSSNDQLIQIPIFKHWIRRLMRMAHFNSRCCPCPILPVFHGHRFQNGSFCNHF